MSWTDGVDWQQFNRDLRNIEMLRLQQEQNELLKKSVSNQQNKNTAPSSSISSEIEDEFELLQQAERESLDTRDAAGFINMGNWWYNNECYEEAYDSYSSAAIFSFEDTPPPADFCNIYAFTARHLGKVEVARRWWQKGSQLGDANCANTLIFSYLIPEEKWEEIDKYVSLGAANDAGAATTGLISNSAISLYMRGNPDDAVKQFKVALERPDKAANTEAYWWLSKIFAEKNEVSISENYYTMCQQAGGYTPPAWA
jgi:hypothetical protein